MFNRRTIVKANISPRGKGLFYVKDSYVIFLALYALRATIKNLSKLFKNQVLLVLNSLNRNIFNFKMQFINKLKTFKFDTNRFFLIKSNTYNVFKLFGNFILILKMVYYIKICFVI